MPNEKFYEDGENQPNFIELPDDEPFFSWPSCRSALFYFILGFLICLVLCYTKVIKP